MFSVDDSLLFTFALFGLPIRLRLLDRFAVFDEKAFRVNRRHTARSGCRLAGTSARLVNIVHDEIIVEADASEAESAADKLEKAMCAAGEEYISRVPVKVDVKIADEWAK